MKRFPMSPPSDAGARRTRSLPTAAARGLALLGALLGAQACSSEQSPGPGAEAPMAGAGGSGVSGAGGTGTAGTGGTPTPSGGNAGAGANGGGSAGSTASGGAGGSGGTAGSAGTGGMTPAGDLALSASEFVFSGVQNTRSAVQTLTLQNGTADAVTLQSVGLDPAAPGSDSFEVVSAPASDMELGAGQQASVEVVFEPSGVGVFESRLLVQTSLAPAERAVGLFGLGAQGLEGENEPALALVVQTLGFAVDVGGTALRLGTGAAPIGDEVPAARFMALGDGRVRMVPVARYSPEEPIPYGFYVGEQHTVVGTIASDQFQTLHPGVTPGSEPSFDPPAGEFGLYTESETHRTYTEDALNQGNPTLHAVRTYPLKDRQGNLVENAYLVGFEEAANGDYQDYVFVVENVTPLGD